MNVSRFDEFSQALAPPLGRRQALKVAAGVLAVLWPRRASAQLLTCGFLTAGATLRGSGCAAGAIAPLPGVCAALSATVLSGILCPTACPVTVSSFSCTCSGTTAAYSANTVCACAPGTVTCPSTCPPAGCANCGACGTVCPRGTCCVAGVCTSSAGGACTIC